MDDMCRTTGLCIVTQERLWSRCPVCHCIYSEYSDCVCDDEGTEEDDSDGTD